MYASTAASIAFNAAAKVVDTPGGNGTGIGGIVNPTSLQHRFNDASGIGGKAGGAIEYGDGKIGGVGIGLSSQLMC
jgi:hypothetical protein